MCTDNIELSEVKCFGCVDTNIMSINKVTNIFLLSIVDCMEFVDNSREKPANGNYAIQLCTSTYNPSSYLRNFMQIMSYLK